MHRLNLFTYAATLALLGACGDPSDSTATGTSDTTDASTGSGGASTGTPTSTTPTTGDTTGDATDDTGPSCDMFADKPAAPTVQFAIVNQRATPVYVRHWVFCGRPVVPLEIAALAAPDVPLNWWRDETENDCSEFGCDCEGGGEASPDSLIKLDPGGSYRETWNGEIYREIEAPAECVGVTVCTAACVFGEQAPPAMYQVRAEAGTEVAGGGDCEVDPQLGFCSLIDGFTPGGEALTATAELAYPEADTVELVFVD